MRLLAVPHSNRFLRNLRARLSTARLQSSFNDRCPDAGPAFPAFPFQRETTAILSALCKRWPLRGSRTGRIRPAIAQGVRSCRIPRTATVHPRQATGLDPISRVPSAVSRGMRTRRSPRPAVASRRRMNTRPPAKGSRSCLRSERAVERSPDRRTATAVSAEFVSADDAAATTRCLSGDYDSRGLLTLQLTRLLDHLLDRLIHGCGKPVERLRQRPGLDRR